MQIMVLTNTIIIYYSIFPISVNLSLALFFPLIFIKDFLSFIIFLSKKLITPKKKISTFYAKWNTKSTTTFEYIHPKWKKKHEDLSKAFIVVICTTTTTSQHRNNHKSALQPPQYSSKIFLKLVAATGAILVEIAFLHHSLSPFILNLSSSESRKKEGNPKPLIWFFIYALWFFGCYSMIA